MKKYRVRKVGDIYYPQFRIILWWDFLKDDGFAEPYSHSSSVCFATNEEAIEFIKRQTPKEISVTWEGHA